MRISREYSWVSRRARSRHSSRVRPLTAMRCQPCARDESTGSPVLMSSPIVYARLASRSRSGGESMPCSA